MLNVKIFSENRFQELSAQEQMVEKQLFFNKDFEIDSYLPFIHEFIIMLNLEVGIKKYDMVIDNIKDEKEIRRIYISTIHTNIIKNFNRDEFKQIISEHVENNEKEYGDRLYYSYPNVFMCYEYEDENIKIIDKEHVILHKKFITDEEFSMVMYNISYGFEIK